ncbi:MAG: DUF2357 domain-containing protein, partial [Clostridia bacterium]|nr:DUF2357 domain-containing protein [Clostridia bacterium]
MLGELDVIDLYEKSSKKRTDGFTDNIESTLRVQTDIKKEIKDLSWIDIMEEVIPHIDAIFRNPNRFIINDEEIVKIESARKVTVESIKHLAKNTNLIQTVDDKTGDVQPGKILNVNKEEDYDTYENRLIYTLVQKMKMFVDRRVKFLDLKIKNDNKDNKAFDYDAKSKILGENVEVKFEMNSFLDNDNSNEDDTETLLLKIEEIKKKINELTGENVYKIIDKKNIQWIKEPIRKTNVILKNVHFQYAMKLWEYLKENFDEKEGKVEEKKDYMDDGDLKHLMDETFLLQYLAMKTLDKDEAENEETSQELKSVLIEGLIDKILDVDEDIKSSNLKQLVAAKYEVV